MQKQKAGHRKRFKFKARPRTAVIPLPTTKALLLITYLYSRHLTASVSGEISWPKTPQDILATADMVDRTL